MISNDCFIGEDTVVYQPELVNIYGAVIGENCVIGAFVEIQKGVRIGNRVKIQAGAFICEGVTIGNGVFIGPGAHFTNCRHPAAVNPDGTLRKKGDWKLEETLVEDGVSIGAGCVILPGLILGHNSVIGAGAVVTKNVPADSVVIGNPARLM